MSVDPFLQKYKYAVYGFLNRAVEIAERGTKVKKKRVFLTILGDFCSKYVVFPTFFRVSKGTKVKNVGIVDSFSCFLHQLCGFPHVFACQAVGSGHLASRAVGSMHHISLGIRLKMCTHDCSGYGGRLKG